MPETLVTQSSTIRRILSDPARGRVVLVSASGCAIYRLSDWTRVAWAALANITCGAINDNGIYLGTSAAGVYRLPLAANGLATSNLVRVFGIGAPVELTSAIIKDLAGYGSSLAIVTSVEMVFLPSPAVGYAYTGEATPLLCAVNADRLAWATDSTVYVCELPASDWADTLAQTTLSARGIDYAGSDLIICHPAGLTVAAEGTGTVPTSGLVSHYTMDNITGSALVDEQAAYNGTITGAVQTTGSGGKFDESLSFDGVDDGVAISKNVISQAAFTVAIWEYSSSAATIPDGYILADEADPANLLIRRNTSGANINAYIGDQQVTVTAPRNQWNLLILDHDGSGNGRLFINTTATPAASISSSNFAALQAALWLGNRAALDRDFQGKLDQLRIYNRLLTAAERLSLLNEGAGIELSLRAYGATDLGTVTDCRAAWKDGALLAYGTSDDEDGGRFGVLDVTDPEDPVSKTTTAGDVTGAVWIDDALTAAVYDNQLERYRLVAELSPTANATGVRRDWTLYAEITDALGGIQTGTVALTVNGVSQTPTVAAVTNGFAVTYTPAGNSGYNERVTIGLSGTDSDGQTVSRTWVFTTASAPALTATDASPPNVVCIRDIDLATAESDEVVGGVNVVWLDTHTSPLIVTEAQSREVGRVKIDETTFHRHRVGVRVLATDSNGLQTRDLRPGSIATITCAALGMTAQKCEILAAQRTIDDSDEDISFDLQAAYYEEV
jgi:hypothetical protein